MSRKSWPITVVVMTVLTVMCSCLLLKGIDRHHQYQYVCDHDRHDQYFKQVDEREIGRNRGYFQPKKT